MSRLQVGGLALIINAENPKNNGKVVSLLKYIGEICWIDDGWEISSDDGLLNVFDEPRDTGVLSAKNLVPLGDKQTQDELKKEKELENV